MGIPVEGKRAVIIDDVMTSGKAIRGALDKTAARWWASYNYWTEVGQDEVSSTGREVRGLIGQDPVKAEAERDAGRSEECMG